MRINLSKAEPNSEFEPEILTKPHIVDIKYKYRTEHFYSEKIIRAAPLGQEIFGN